MIGGPGLHGIPTGLRDDDFVVDDDDDDDDNSTTIPIIKPP
jgi:hypothetical protein